MQQTLLPIKRRFSCENNKEKKKHSSFFFFSFARCCSLQARLESSGRALALFRDARRRALYPIFAAALSHSAAPFEVLRLERAAQLEEAPGRGGVEGLIFFVIFFPVEVERFLMRSGES